MLDAHPEMCIPPETGFIPVAIRLHGQGAGLREGFFHKVTNFPTWQDFNLSPEAFHRALVEIDPFDVSAGMRAFYRLYAARFDKKRWGDKTPGYCLSIDEIQTFLPEARFIHLIRDGRDVALSLRGLWFAPGHDMTTLARDWRSHITKARELSQRCRHYLEIRYEDLVYDTTAELQKICDFVDLPYDPRRGRYFEFARTRLDEVKTGYNLDGTVLITKEERLFNHRFTNEPPDTSRVFRWKQEMTPEMRAEFESVAGQLLAELGYETQQQN
ncbi:MAG: sulfotransferase [Armatimonadota bacterium]|nr:sulfotransferase [Armatimonadota bacterium]